MLRSEDRGEPRLEADGSRQRRPVSQASDVEMTAAVNSSIAHRPHATHGPTLMHAVCHRPADLELTAHHCVP